MSHPSMSHVIRRIHLEERRRHRARVAWSIISWAVLAAAVMALTWWAMDIGR